MSYPWSTGEILLAADLNDAFADAGIPAAVNFTPVGNTDGSTGGYTNWVTLGSLTVPTWCTSIIAIVTCSGIHSITNTSSYDLRLRIGSAGPVSTAESHISWIATGTRLSTSIVGEISAPGTGAQDFIIQAERIAGSGQARADTTSHFSAVAWYRA
jgi:hypothetical protein